MDFDKIDSAIELLQQIAASTTEQGVPLLLELTRVEASMSLAEKCHYAFQMAATAKGIEIEDIEAELNFSAVQLETTTEDNREAFLSAARSMLYGKLHNERAAEIAMGVLAKLPQGEGTPKQRGAIAQIAFLSTTPSVMN